MRGLAAEAAAAQAAAEEEVASLEAVSCEALSDARARHQELRQLSAEYGLARSEQAASEERLRRAEGELRDAEAGRRGLAQGRRALGLEHEAGRLPLIGSDVPVVDCRLEGPRPFGGPCRIVIVKDMLLIGRRPGEAEESVLLTGAKISAQGATAACRPG